MIKLIIIFVVITIVIIFLEVWGNRNEEELPKYQYKKKDFFMSKPEHELYKVLINAVGEKYYVFPQVHLPSIIDNKVVGQNWKSAFKHINQKSVDFVLCDKDYISPKLAIELDDRTHNRQDRIERDIEVERILKEAKIPLLRLENHGQFNVIELVSKIDTILNLYK